MFTIQDIINTLNQVEVRGKENMDRLLGAILALEFILKAQNDEAKDHVVIKEEEGGEVNG